MKKDLERWSDKLTPEEERRIWSKMKGTLRGSESADGARTRFWTLRPWVTSAAVAAVAVIVVVAVWRTHEPRWDLAQVTVPDRVVETDARSEVADRTMDGEVLAEPPDVATARASKSDATRDKDAAEGQAVKAKPEGDEVGKQAPKLLAGTQQEQLVPPLPTGIEEEGMGMMEVAKTQEGVEGKPEEDARAGALGYMAEEAETRSDEDGSRATAGTLADDVDARELKQKVSGPVAATTSPGAGAKSFMAATESSATAGEGFFEAAPGPVTTAKEAVEASPDREAATEGPEQGATTESPDSVSREAYREALRELDAREQAGPAQTYMMGTKSSAKKEQTSERGEIRGQITDASGNPLANAQVVVVGTRFGAMTDEKGFFVIRNIPVGTYSLRVTMTGYDELLIYDVVVEKDQTRDMPAVQLKEEGAEEAEDKTSVTGPKYMFGKLFNRGKKRAASQTQTAAPDMEGSMDEMMCAPSTGQALKPAPGYPSLTGGSRPVNDELADDMFFQHYGTNPFVEAKEDALSTFGLDVDTGSYTICRSYIHEGHLPPTEAVRVEEFVNFFRKDFPPPRRDDLRIHVDGMPSPFAHVQDGSYWLLRVGIRGRVIDERDRLPAQIVLVIDTSGSMGMGNRLGMLKASMDVLLNELRPNDEIGVVEFKTRARVVLPITPVSEGVEIHRAIQSLRAGGSTNAEHGLELGYEMMRKAARSGRIHRIILCSDGVANEGNTGWESILENVRRERDRISLMTIGFGMGNYNDVLMEQLADAGDGHYAYVDDLREATRVLRENFTGTMQTIARNAKAQIEFDPNYVDKYRLLGYENRDVRDQDFRKDDVDAGEIGAGHEVTVLYEVKLKPELGRRRLATVHLRYERPEGGRVVELDEPVRIGDFWGEVYDAPADLIVDACVAEFAEILRGSYWAKDGSLADVLDLLRDATREMTSQPDVDELVDLVERALDLDAQE